MLQVSNYENDYTSLPFEDILRGYRRENIFRSIKHYAAKRILEIGCGPDPLFIHFNDFDSMLVVEPGNIFFEKALAAAGANPKIRVTNAFIEDLAEELEKEQFDFIIIGGFLHEISNPEQVLQSVKKIAAATTVVHSFVPNARSFHRLLAFESGIIDSIYKKSAHDELFQRTSVYDADTYSRLFTDNGFRVSDAGSYFIKPFTHTQMVAMLSNGIIDGAVLNGLNKMTGYLPGLGAELYVNCTLQS